MTTTPPGEDVPAPPPAAPVAPASDGNATACAPAGETQDDGGDRPHSDSRVTWLRLAKLPVAFVAGAAALTLTLFQLHDRIWPPATVHGGEVIAADLVQLHVPYGQYVVDHPLLYPDKEQTLERAGEKVIRAGAVVDVVLRLQGLRGRDCRAVYTVYETPLTPRIGPVQALKKCTANVQDGDMGGWAAWVELPRVKFDARHRPIMRHLFIRFDLMDDDGLFLGPGKNTQVFAWDGTGE